MMYASRRFLRTGSIHGSRFSSLMNTVYRRHLDAGVLGFTRTRRSAAGVQAELPHPGSVAGQIAIMATMPGLLEYVGGGFNRFGVPAWLGGASHETASTACPGARLFRG